MERPLAGRTNWLLCHGGARQEKVRQVKVKVTDRPQRIGEEKNVVEVQRLVEEETQ